MNRLAKIYESLLWTNSNYGLTQTDARHGRKKVESVQKKLRYLASFVPAETSNKELYVFFVEQGKAECRVMG